MIVLSVGGGRLVGWGRSGAVGWGRSGAVGWRWGRFVGWGRSRLVGRLGGLVGLSLRILSFSFVGNFSHVSGVSINVVSDLLGTAVGKSNVVGSLSVVTVTAFLGIEVGTVVIILDSIVEGVFWGL